MYTEGMDPEQVEEFDRYLDAPPDSAAASRRSDSMTFASLYGEIE